MKVYSIFLACLLLAPSLPLAAADPVEVKIGLLNPLTGPVYYFAPGFTDAAEVAIAELNEIYPEYEFSLTEADSGCDGTTAASAAQSLIDNGVVGIAGAACSGATLGAIDVAADAGVPMISYASSSPALTDYDDDDYLFRVYPSDAQLSQAMAAVAYSAGFRNPAVVAMTNDYGAGTANAFVNEWYYAMDQYYCGEFTFDDDDTDFSNIVWAIHDNACDSVVLVSYADNGAAFIEEMHYQHLDIPILGGDGIAYRDFRYEFSDESLLNGVMATMYAPIPESDEREAFEEAYEEADGSDCPDYGTCIYIHEAYDAVMIMGHAAVLDSDGDLRYEIYNIGDEYQGASGLHTFMSSGDTVGPGYEICMFSYDYDDDYVDLTCPYDWNLEDGLDASYFTCANGREIMEVLEDNRVNNCRDWSDEPNVDVFVCDNGNTIRGDYYDDGFIDCGDGSDEYDSHFVCDNGETIPAAYVNDGDNDCGDWSDEDDGYFVCDNGGMIPEYYVNDGYDDCGDGSDETDGYFVCDNGDTIPMGWVNDGYDDCGDGSDEDGSDDDGMRFGLPTGQLGFIDSEEMDDMNEEISLKFVTPHRAEIESYGVVNLDGDTSDTLREDIILASSIREIEAYFVEGQSAIIMDYTNGEIDDEEMIEALMGLHENATQSVFPAYDSDSYGASEPGDEFFIKFDTADTIFSYADEEHAYWNVSVTPDMVNNYHDVAWGDGMNNLLTLDMALTFGILIVIIASFEDYDGDKANATFTQMLMDSMKVCPENSGAFSVMLCVLNQYMIAATEMFGEEFMEPEEDGEEIWETYCLDSAKQVLKNAGASCPTGSTKVFYDMSDYDLHGLSMDNVNPVDSMNLMEQPDSFPMFSPDMSMRISDTSNVLGTLSENAGKETSVELELRATAFFPGVSAGDTHTFVINPDEGGEFFENVSILRVLPPSGYAITEGPKEALSAPFEETSWTFEKVEAPPVEEPPEEETNETIEEEEIVEVLEDSGLPGPGLLVVLLTILGVASVRRRF